MATFCLFLSLFVKVYSKCKIEANGFLNQICVWLALVNDENINLCVYVCMYVLLPTVHIFCIWALRFFRLLRECDLFSISSQLPPATLDDDVYL